MRHRGRHQALQLPPGRGVVRRKTDDALRPPGGGPWIAVLNFLDDSATEGRPWLGWSPGKRHCGKAKPGLCRLSVAFPSACGMIDNPLSVSRRNLLSPGRHAVTPREKTGTDEGALPARTIDIQVVSERSRPANRIYAEGSSAEAEDGDSVGSLILGIRVCESGETRKSPSATSRTATRK